MGTFAFARHAVGIAAAIVLVAGCGGSQPPIGSPDTAALAQRLTGRAGEVQYFSNVYGGALLEYDYPKSKSPIGSITFNGGVGCTKGARTFWAMASDEIAEFKVGGSTPIRALKARASDCAIDSATGDLAALLVSGGVIIFHDARGKGKVITTPLARRYFEGYDDKGNLFVDGFNSGHSVGLVELKRGSGAFETITTSNTIEFPGSVQW